MSEYIECDKLIERLKAEIEEHGNPNLNYQPVAYGSRLGLTYGLAIANTLPTEDVVEVVRCKDCKHWKQVTEERHACYILGWEMDYDEYCSRGERKGQK